MKYHINVSSKQGMQKQKKISINPTSSIHIVMYIVTEVYFIDSHPHQQFIS